MTLLRDVARQRGESERPVGHGSSTCASVVVRCVLAFFSKSFRFLSRAINRGCGRPIVARDGVRGCFRSYEKEKVGFVGCCFGMLCVEKGKFQTALTFLSQKTVTFYERSHNNASPVR